MGSTDTFCLKWADFKETVSTTFRSLREDTEFTDVTLACEDGIQVEAHKVILAASSPFFQKLLRRNKHPHPLIYMRGMKSEDLVAMMNFLYYGEANINQVNLDSFLAIAEDLKLNGLTRDSNNFQIDNIPTPLPETKHEIEAEIFQEIQSQSNISNVQCKESGGEVDLDDKIGSMYVQLDHKKDGRDVYKCQVCGKEGSIIFHMRNHIEANHIEGDSVPCNFCKKTFKTRNALRLHKHGHTKI